MWAILICLLAHPLIDGFTVYGTQSLWPLPMRPVMWSSLFIIDPLFTLPWLLAFAVAWFALERPLAQRALVSGIAIGVAYVGWSLTAKAMVERGAGRALATMGLFDAPHFLVPMPFNTLLWRVVAMTPGGFVEGERSLVADHGPMTFHAYRCDVAAIQAVRAFQSPARLLWFNHHFAKAERIGDELVLSDLRMESEPDYSFRFAVAAHGVGERTGGWQEIAPRQLRFAWRSPRGLPSLWRRIWQGPTATPATQSSR